MDTNQDKQQKEDKMSNEVLKKLDVSQIDYKQKDVIVHRFISKYPEFSKELENLDQSQRIAFFDAFIESQHKFVDFMNTPSLSGRTWKNKDEVK